METNTEQLFAEAEQAFENLDNEAAAKIYQQILAGEPSNAVAWQGLARCLDAMGDTRHAQDAAKKALALDATLALPHYTLGRTLCLQGKYKPAMLEINQVIELAPDLPHGYSVLGDIALHRNDYLDAQKEFGVALTKNMNCDTSKLSIKRHTHILVALAYAEIKLMNFADAEGYATRALAMDNENDYALINLIVAYRKQKKGDKAVELANAAFSRHKSWRRFRIVIAAYLAKYPLLEYAWAGLYLLCSYFALVLPQPASGLVLIGVLLMQLVSISGAFQDKDRRAIVAGVFSFFVMIAGYIFYRLVTKRDLPWS